MLVLTCSSDTVPCPLADQVWVSVAQLVDPAVLGITSAGILETFGWGVSAVLLLWSFGFATGAAVSALRKA